MGRALCRRFQLSVGLYGAFCLVLLGGLLLGCSRGSFVGRQYDDFAAYYNTYHNAEKAFEKGLESVTQSELDIDRGRYISVFPNPQSGSGESAFDNAIEKCADLLRNHPNSKWVDDALLLIGRARYYKQNYVGAAQKFREVIALEGEREEEARFRLARTLLAADRYSEAAEVLRTGMEQDGEGSTWTARMRLVQGELFVRQETWTEAEQALDRGLRGSLPAGVGARGSFLLGQVRETLGDLDGAQSAYRRVLDYDPTYQLAFAARLGAIEVQGLSDDPVRALDRLESLERGDNTNKMRAGIARVRARLYQEQGRPQEAKQVLTNILRGENAPRGMMMGRIHYDLAALYRDTFEDFTKAAAHFDTAATALPSESGGDGSGADPQDNMLPGTPSDAVAKAERFQGLAGRSQAVARMDSLLRLGRMPPAEFRSVVEEIRKRRLKEQEQEAQRQRRQQFQQRELRQGESSQSQQNAVQTRSSDAGFLFHRDQSLVQQGRRQFEQTWGNRPLVDNWRRVNAIQGSNATASTENEERQGGGPSGPQGQPEQLIDLSVVPRDSASQAQMEKNRAVARYRLANALFRDAGRPDSSETWFLLVLGETPEHPVARKALYGLAQAHQAQDDTTAAQMAYRYLIEEYPGTPYAKRAREQLGLNPVASSSNRAVSRADSAYAHAYQTWQKGAPDAALDQFLAVAKTYPKTSSAPRALLAAGVVYHRNAQRDTSGPLKTRFERYVDSLAQSSDTAAVEGEASADTTGEFQGAIPSSDTSVAETDTSAVQNQLQQPVDTTTTRRTPQPTPTPSRQTADTGAASDTSRGDETPSGPPRRRVDSTAIAEQDRPPQRSDTTTTDTTAASPSTAASDTTTRSELAADSVRAMAQKGGQPDSVQANSNRNRPRPLEVLLTHLTRQYSGTPMAKRAKSLLDYLETQQVVSDSVSSDSLASEALSGPDTTQDSTTATSDSTARPGSPQTPAAVPDSTARTRPSSDTIRAGEGVTQPMRRRDSTAAPNPDSTASPEQQPDSLGSPDSTGE